MDESITVGLTDDKEEGCVDKEYSLMLASTTDVVSTPHKGDKSPYVRIVDRIGPNRAQMPSTTTITDVLHATTHADCATVPPGSSARNNIYTVRDSSSIIYNTTSPNCIL
jgi:hypothetical protein